jgi:hypothetical protein
MLNMKFRGKPLLDGTLGATDTGGLAMSDLLLLRDLPGLHIIPAERGAWIMQFRFEGGEGFLLGLHD